MVLVGVVEERREGGQKEEREVTGRERSNGKQKRC